jgi:hypothetical protein
LSNQENQVVEKQIKTLAIPKHQETPQRKNKKSFLRIESKKLLPKVPGFQTAFVN